MAAAIFNQPNRDPDQMTSGGEVTEVAVNCDRRYSDFKYCTFDTVAA
jgi:hypothetical protein